VTLEGCGPSRASRNQLHLQLTPFECERIVALSSAAKKEKLEGSPRGDLLTNLENFA